MPDSSERKVLRVGEWILFKPEDQGPPEIERKTRELTPLRVTEIHLEIEPRSENERSWVPVPAVPWLSITAGDPCVTIWAREYDSETSRSVPLDRIRHYPFND